MYRTAWSPVLLYRLGAVLKDRHGRRVFLGDKVVTGVVPGGTDGPMLLVAGEPDYVRLFDARPGDFDVFTRDPDPAL